ncbi:MAG: branched-chain amino acid transaminase [Dehalococcoidia bacterium]
MSPTPYAFIRGEMVPLEEAKVGIMTHALHYGTAVFEGIRGNWNPDKQVIYIFRLREHYQRLLQGCRILLIDLPYTLDELCDITVELVERSGYTEDLYIRPIAYKSAQLVANLKLHELESDFALLAIPFGDYLGAEVQRCCTSSWRRIDDPMIPPRFKISGLYVNSILAKTEAVLAGFDEAIMLNQDGHVCEGTGENLFLVKDGELFTPSLEDNVLSGITRNTVIALARNELGVEVRERSIDRSELYVADELFLTGTAAHLTPVGEIDHRKIGDGNPGPLTRALQEMYFQIAKGNNPKYLHWCTAAVPRSVRARTGLKARG